MKKGKIIDIKDINELECAVTYDVLNNKKDALYKKDSKQLLDCINRYIEFLQHKDRQLRQKGEDQILYKRIFSCIFILIITLLLVYFIMSITLSKSYIISLVGYIISLLLLALSFLVSYNMTYKIDLKIQNNILQNENEILRAESIRDNCKEIIENKKSNAKSKK